MILSEAIEAVGRMVSGYPNSSNISKSYVGTIASLLCTYPRQIAIECADPIKGVVRESEFMPTVAKIVAWCEARVGTMRTTVDYDERSAAQLAERERLEQEQRAESPEYRAAVVQRIREDMSAHGMPIMGDAKHAHIDTAERVRERYGLSEAEWDAIPDAPMPGEWERLRARHKADAQDSAAYRPTREAAE